jgi:hypothetical protein
VVNTLDVLTNQPRALRSNIMTDATADAPRHLRGRFLVLLGLLLAVLGIAAYIVQISLQRLWAPWYVPTLATLGALLVLVSLFERRTAWRFLALVVVVLLAGAEWAIILAERLPAYKGPIAVGQPFPAFQTSRADGTPFTERDLTGKENNVLVVFRGRW